MSYIEQFRQLPPDQQATAVRRMLGGVSDPGRIEMGLALVLTNEDTARTALAMSPPPLPASSQSLPQAPQAVAPPSGEELQPNERVETYEDFIPANQAIPAGVAANAEPATSAEGMPPDWVERALQIMAGGAAVGAGLDAYRSAQHTPAEVVPDPTIGKGIKAPRQGNILSPEMDQLGDLRSPSYEVPPTAPQITEQRKLTQPPDIDAEIRDAMRLPAASTEQSIIDNIPDGVRYGPQEMPLPGKPPIQSPVEEKVETLDDLTEEKQEVPAQKKVPQQTFEPVTQRGVAGYKRADSMGVDRYYDEKGNYIGTIDEYEDYVDKRAGPTQLERESKTVQKKKAPIQKTQTKETASQVESAVKATATKKKSTGLPENAHPFQYQNRTYYVGDMNDNGEYEIYTKTGRRAGESISKRAQIAAAAANRDRSAQKMKAAKQNANATKKAGKAARAVSKAIK